MQTPETIIDHRIRIRRVMLHVDRHLDNHCRLHHLADVACFSPYHFLRVFESCMGETPGQYVVRKRMEKAAFHLLKTDRSVIDIALMVGYETPNAFSKVFKTHFQIPPRRFRDAFSEDQLIHPNRLFLPVVSHRPRPMAPVFPVIKHLPPIKVLYVENCGIRDGSFFSTAVDSFRRLSDLIRRHDIGGIVKAPLGIYPQRVFNLEDGRAISQTGVSISRPVGTLKGLFYRELPPGRHALFKHYGPYEFMMQTWNKAYINWLPRSGRMLRDAPPFEIYLNRTLASNLCQHTATIFLPIQ